MRKLVLAFLLVLVAWGGLHWWHRRPLGAPEGVLAAGAPVEDDLPSGAGPSMRRGKFTLEVRASFELTARVLSREDYEYDDLAPIVPVDLALGWDRMSENEVLKKIRISQSNRFYYWYVDDFPIPRREIEESSANMHMIPADADVERALHNVHSGQVVHIEGFLVDARRDDGRTWQTSRSRDDTGAGACEIVYVESITVER
jgi:hypothetical protein